MRPPRFITEPYLLAVCSRAVAAGLLVAHLLLLAAFAQWRWAGPQGLAGTLRAFCAGQAERRSSSGGRTRHRKIVAADTAVAGGIGGVADSGADGNGGSTHGTRSGDSAAGSAISISPADRGADGGSSGGNGSSRSRAGAGSTSSSSLGDSGGNRGGFATAVSPADSPASERLPTGEAVWIVWSGNFVGILCARTLHYQFYSWYCHSLPLLLWSTGLATWQKLGLWCCIEVVWNVYPPTAGSSGVLMACHCILLIALWRRQRRLSNDPVKL